MFRQPLKSTQAQFCIGPERFNTIDVTITCSKLIGAMMDAEVLFITQVDQPIVGTPAFGMYHAAQVHATPNHC